MMYFFLLFFCTFLLYNQQLFVQVITLCTASSRLNRCRFTAGTLQTTFYTKIKCSQHPVFSLSNRTFKSLFKTCSFNKQFQAESVAAPSLIVMLVTSRHKTLLLCPNATNGLACNFKSSPSINPAAMTSEWLFCAGQLCTADASHGWIEKQKEG